MSLEIVSWNKSSLWDVKHTQKLLISVGQSAVALEKNSFKEWVIFFFFLNFIIFSNKSWLAHC